MVIGKMTQPNEPLQRIPLRSAVEHERWADKIFTHLARRLF